MKAYVIDTFGAAAQKGTTDQPTDRPTNQPTDGPTKRDVESRGTQLKIRIYHEGSEKVFERSQSRWAWAGSV